MDYNILIVAQGQVAQTFINKIVHQEYQGYRFSILTTSQLGIEQNQFVQFVKFDPTSLYRLRKFTFHKKFKSIFILLENMDEAKIIYNNIRSFDQKIRIIILDRDGTFKKDFSDSYVKIIDSVNILANRLYDHLPNVPVVAQNVGLHEGEIMEVVVPFSSPFAFRHISTIAQVKWKIAAIYRDNKLLLPSNATMIRPRDMLLIVGKPQILQSVFKRIRSQNSVLPEPFGKNFYLYLDIQNDSKRAIEYIQEAIYFLSKFENKSLVIRVTRPNDLKIVEQIKAYERDNVTIYFTFEEINEGILSDDIYKNEIGLIMLSFDSLKQNSCSKTLYAYKKLIYLFGETKISDVKEATVVYNNKKTIEEISSVAFYISEALNLKLSLRIYEPEGKFEQSNFAIEHFETLSHVHNIKVETYKYPKNPIKAVKRLKNILLVIPFSQHIDFDSFMVYFQRDIDSLLIRTNSHPKLLIPIIEN